MKKNVDTSRNFKNLNTFIESYKLIIVAGTIPVSNVTR